MIEVQGLVKRYGDAVAVDGVSFTAQPGSVFGLLGPNGAGKSSTIGCISGLFPPSAGSVRVLGHDVVREERAAKQRLGVVPQDLALYEDLSAIENLSYWGAAYGLRKTALKARVEVVLEQIGLRDRGKDPAKSFSGGMKRRLNLGCALVHEPDVLLLDEPTVGVDPQSRVRLLELVKSAVQAGTCVLYTTHYMEEASELCDELAIVDGGKIIASGTLDELRNQTGGQDILRITGKFPVEAVRARLGEGAALEIKSVEPGELRLALEGGSSRLAELLNLLTDAGAEIWETTLTRPSLESLFIQLTGKELRE